MSISVRNAVHLVVRTATTALLLGPAVGLGDVVLDWNAIMQTTVGAQPPFPQARFAAITQLAVFEAVNAITGDYKPYLGTITVERIGGSGSGCRRTYRVEELLPGQRGQSGCCAGEFPRDDCGRPS